VSWFEWMQPGVPCFFSAEQAKDNAGFLRDFLSANFIDRRSRSHPILKMWDQKSVDAFLSLNALADDLRLAATKDGIDAVRNDLRSANMTDSARHTIHTAALFERERAGSLLRFFEARNETIPDYLVEIGGEAVPVEAKMVLTSEVDQQFISLASPAIRQVIAALKDKPQTYDVFRLARNATWQFDAREVANSIASLPAKPDSYQMLLAGFKAWVKVRDKNDAIGERRTIYMFAPVHENDHLKLKGPAKQASKQLRALPDVRWAHWFNFRANKLN
jgi:hypothetical protein